LQCFKKAQRILEAIEVFDILRKETDVTMTPSELNKLINDEIWNLYFTKGVNYEDIDDKMFSGTNEDGT
jgi:hypothetical protein